MPVFNFDEIIDRNGTDALKTDFLEERFGRKDLIPLWIADMDFPAPPAIAEAVTERCKHGIFGYTHHCEGYHEAIIDWLSEQHGWPVKQEWITFIPGVVKGIAFVIDCFTTQQNRIVIQPPVYQPFSTIPALHHRHIVTNPLILDEGSGVYNMDLEHLRSIITPETKLLILCNPHNPGGRVWTRTELAEIAEICYQNDILVISDEIHSDLAMQNHKHIPFASVSEHAAQNSITLMAPSKTFNMAGFVSSFAVVPNPEIRKKFFAFLESSELNQAHCFASIATKAAYRNGLPWLKEVKEYIWQNCCFVDQYLKENIPQIKALKPQASFLIWLDCRGLKLPQNELADLFVKDAKLALNDGAMFGKEGIGFMRMNVGTPRRILEEALSNLKIAVDKCTIK
ncbi:cystathionine beta-lyase [Dysgonomonas sp. PH5-45]|uniref:MalY/PatB family protein n=1 Tax=unclassified Dysgonomonas TaxID=2630389 RepID=UPI002475D0E1|nr:MULTISPECIES: PatB family C-S lyase [unclassified Dysgonomonas]MDH6354248.1 cystathionine beta-lyase [Dysgonomonas sp. PH5-45]MDH6387149.1 cystathionine beta-lyase [Dysgonomonas sp. PH5-37]